MPVGLPGVRPLRRERSWAGAAAAAILAVLVVVLALVLLFAQFPQIALAPAASPPPGARLTPNVIGKDVNDAAAILLAAGFRDRQGAQLIDWEEDRSARGAPCSVARQEPREGTAYQPGAYAKLFLVPGGTRDCRSK